MSLIFCIIKQLIIWTPGSPLETASEFTTKFDSSIMMRQVNYEINIEFHLVNENQHCLALFYYLKYFSVNLTLHVLVHADDINPLPLLRT